MTPAFVPEGRGNRNADIGGRVPASLRPVQAKFCALIVQRILTFEALRKDLETGQNPQQALLDMAALAHKIAGVAETLGFSKAGRSAAEVERRITKGMAVKMQNPAIWGAVQPVLDSLLDELEALLDD